MTVVHYLNMSDINKISALGGLIMQNLGLETLLVVGAVACAAGASFMLLSNLKK